MGAEFCRQREKAMDGKNGFRFQLEKVDKDTAARVGMITTAHGQVPTPIFMPVGTQATVKAVTPEQLEEIRAKIILSNAYHLYLRPGLAVIEAVGGLHRFMGWSHPILTDSGGFQVFSLGHLRKIDENGVTFRSHIDGSEHVFTAEKVVEIQETLGSDIAMVLDECTPYPSDHEHNLKALERTLRWAERAKAAHRRPDQAQFGIVQGGMFADLRRMSAERLAAMDFPGYGIGGLSVGEPKGLTYGVVAETTPWMPTGKPRYLMGVGAPEDLLECVALGVDMFDSVLPTRVARNGAIFTGYGRRNIKNAVFRTETGPLEEGCDCYTCQRFSAAYVHHLFKAEELLAYTLASIHNLRFMLRLMESTRQSILNDSFTQFKAEFLGRYQITDQQARMAQRQKWLEARGEGDDPRSHTKGHEGE
jgi:queuine tRNA-ribosyltransferase